ncbi:MAG: beta-lactamase family protein [Candidatus Eremiobacteraeota bacterium]|nr:beta-lactamase family protein [Candidatus Eremiobacteraeota bacterium]
MSRIFSIPPAGALRISAFAISILSCVACAGPGPSGNAIGGAKSILPDVQTPTHAKADRFDALTRYLRGLVSSGQQPGLGLIVVQNGRIIYEKAFGNQTKRSVIEIASATKMPSALTILSLVRRDLLKLDVPVSKYVPSLFPQGTTITMRELLAHTSGINNCGFNPCEVGKGGGDTGSAPCLHEPYQSLEACAQSIVALGSSFAPGTEFDYGGDDYQVAGYIAQVVAQEPFTQLFADTIGTPCGLTSTYYDASQGNVTNPRIGGGLYTTLEDYAKLLELNLAGGTCNGKRVVSENMIDAMQKDHVSGLPIFYTADPGHDYGLSWWHVAPTTGGNPVVVQDFGKFGASPWIDNHCKYGAFLLIYDMADGAGQGLIIMDTIINNGWITKQLHCKTQHASPT